MRGTRRAGGLAAVVAAVTACGTAAADAATVTVPAAADAHTSALAPLTPRPGATALAVGLTGSAYLRFDVPAVATTVLRAELRVPVTRSAGGTVDLRRTAAGWAEDGVTWLRAPRGQGQIGKRLALPTAGQALTVDVTRLVRGGTPLSVAIDKPSPGDAAFAAREATGGGATLVLTVSGEAQHELAGLLARPDEAGVRHDVKDDRGVSLAGLDLAEARGTACTAAGVPAGAARCYLGVHHTQRPDGHFTTALVVSTDLQRFRHVRDLDDEGSQASLALPADGTALVALERDERDAAGTRLGSHVRVLRWSSPAALAGGAPPASVVDTPRTLSPLNEGTPDVESIAADGTIRFGLHYWDGRVDRAAAGALTPAGAWTATRDEQLDGWVRAHGVAGNVGDRDRVLFGGRSLLVVEGQRVNGDFGTWGLYVVDRAEGGAQPARTTTASGTSSWGNASVERLTLPDGRPGLAFTAYAFSEGSANGEAGPAVWTAPLPTARSSSAAARSTSPRAR